MGWVTLGLKAIIGGVLAAVAVALLLLLFAHEVFAQELVVLDDYTDSGSAQYEELLNRLDDIAQRTVSDELVKASGSREKAIAQYKTQLVLEHDFWVVDCVGKRLPEAQKHYEQLYVDADKRGDHYDAAEALIAKNMLPWSLAGQCSKEWLESKSE